MTLSRGEVPERGRGLILVISAGTSDIPVSEEALVTAQIMGHRAEALYDVGVAGMHRLLAHQELLAQATCFIVVAGMEGALPSVVAGLVDRPVIAVPTSVGYGASSAAWPRCWPCSIPAPPAWPWSTSTTVSAPATWRP